MTRELGPVDVLVNNAGIGFHADALTLSDEDWHRLFAINLEGVVERPAGSSAGRWSPGAPGRSSISVRFPG